jgi:hypothetical protein
MNEQTLKRGLMAVIKKAFPTSVSLRHEDRFTHGIPDLSLSLREKTSWWEVKLADPQCQSKEIQRHMCQRLNAASYCRYVIYQFEIPQGRNKRPRQIRIVPPLDFDAWANVGIVVSEDAFNHYGVVKYMAQVHGVRI